MTVVAPGVQDLGDDLEALDDARAGAVDVLIAVDHGDAAGLRRAQVAPARMLAEQRGVGAGAVEVVAARRDDDHVGVGGRESIPLEAERLAARRADQRLAARQLDQLHRPVPGRHQRVRPLDHGDARSRPRARRLTVVAHALDAALQGSRKLAARLGAAQRLGGALDVGPDVVERVGRERDQAHIKVDQRGDGALHLFEAHGADFALRLGDDVGGREAAQQLKVDLVDAERVGCLRLAREFAHLRIDLAAAPAQRRPRTGDDRQRFDARRIVALVRAPDQRRAQPEAADDLGGAGQ